MSVNEQIVPDGYKQTEVGVIPAEWEVSRLDELISFKNGAAHEDCINEYGDFVLVNSKFISTEGKVRKGSSECRQAAFKNDLLMVMSDVPNGKAIAKCFLVDQDNVYTVNQRICVLTPNHDISPFFLLKTLSRNPYYLAFDDGAKQTNLRKEDVLSCLLVKPPIKEQTAIANALSDVDALLTELEKLIAKKQAIKTATMQQLLTGKTRLPQFATYTEGEKQGVPEGKSKGTKPSELGEIPEDWDVRPIESVIRDLRGGAPFKPNDFTNAGVKVLPKGGVVRGGVLRVHEKDQQFCSKNWSLKYAKNCVDNRYTIVVLRDLVPSGPSIGLMVNIPTDEKYVLAQGVYGFIADDEETSNYLIQYSNTTQYRKAANEIMVGSTQVHITNGAFKALKVPFPPKEERRAIATILSDMDNEIQTLEQRLAKTRQIKQGMMQELLTGRTRLPFEKE
jgi:type I restriction enzyme S subunit